MQTHSRGAVGADRLQGPQHCTSGDGVAHRHGGGDRLVGRAGVAVAHHDHPAPGERSGVGDRAGEGRVHGLTRPAEQVDTPVARSVGRRRRVEASDDLGLGAAAARRRWGRPPRSSATQVPAARATPRAAALGAGGPLVAWADSRGRRPPRARPGGAACGRPPLRARAVDSWRPHRAGSAIGGGGPAAGTLHGPVRGPSSRAARPSRCESAGIRTSADHDGAHSERRPPVGDGPQSLSIGSGRTQASGPN